MVALPYEAAAPAVEPQADPDPAGSRGLTCLVILVVRRITLVRTSGLTACELEASPPGAPELKATPANPPRPTKVALAAILPFKFCTCSS